MRKELLELKEFKAPNDDIINLALNENYYTDWNNLLKDDLVDIILTDQMYKYGPEQHYLLQENYAKYVKVNKENVLVGVGSESIIPYLFTAFATKRIITVNPDFYRYGEIALLEERELVEINIDDNLYKNIVNEASEEDLIIISNPNNPLGIKHKIDDLIYVIENAKGYVCIDEAYIEYSDGSVINLIDKYDNLIVLRTLSKAWGLAGLRVGFVISNKKIIEFLNAIQGPFVLSTINADIANKALAFEDVMQEIVNKTNKVKADIKEFLNSFDDIKSYESNTNFIFIETKDNTKVHQALLKNGVAVTKYKDKGLRITIGNKEQMEIFKDAFNKSMKG